MKALSPIIILVLFAFAKAHSFNDFPKRNVRISTEDDVWCRQHEGFYKTKNDEQIVGGYNDTVQNNPYIVYLSLEHSKEHTFQCGGSIISDNYILTAAHCTQGIVKATIRAGSSEAHSGGEQYTNAQIIVHPHYNSKNLDNDVAVIRTSKPIKLDGINTKAAKLPKQEYVVKSGTNIKVSGWGVTSEGGSVSPTLMSVVVQALSNDVCSQQTGSNITTCQFCAGVPEGGKDSCQGDSGGPAVVSKTKELVGIVSHGRGCARPGQPGVYTRVSCASVRSWIQRVTGV